MPTAHSMSPRPAPTKARSTLRGQRTSFDGAENGAQRNHLVANRYRIKKSRSQQRAALDLTEIKTAKPINLSLVSSECWTPRRLITSVRASTTQVRIRTYRGLSTSIRSKTLDFGHR